MTNNNKIVRLFGMATVGDYFFQGHNDKKGNPRGHWYQVTKIPNRRQGTATCLMMKNMSTGEEIMHNYMTFSESMPNTVVMFKPGN